MSKSAKKELDAIVQEFTTSLRSASRPYVANSGRMTPGLEGAWNRFVVYCMKQALQVAQ